MNKRGTGCSLCIFWTTKTLLLQLPVDLLELLIHNFLYVAMKEANKDLLIKVNEKDEFQNCLSNHEILILNLFPVGARIKYLMLCLHA